MNSKPEAMHVGAADIPWVDTGQGAKIRVLQVKPRDGLWIVESILAKGGSVPTHRHTGPIWAYTLSGAWHYKEYPYVNRAGSFLYEPAGSEHGPEWLEDDTHVYFHMVGALLYLDPDGGIASVQDGSSSLQRYLELCEAARIPRPNVLVD
jgi:2,4'-dihydroxyacetophenone dioxygenase